MNQNTLQHFYCDIALRRIAVNYIRFPRLTVAMATSIMASSAVSANKEACSMVYVEERYGESQEQTQKRIRHYQDAQRVRTSNRCDVSCPDTMRYASECTS